MNLSYVLVLCFVAYVSSYDGRPNVAFKVPQFDVAAETESLKHALYSSNFQTVVNILSHKTYNQRLEIANKFKMNYGKNLKDELEAHVDEDLKGILVALVLPSHIYYARELHHAINGVGTNEDVLIDIICTLTTSEMHSVSDIYESEFGHKLIDDVKGDTSGDFKHFLVALLHFKRDKSGYANKDHAIIDAKALYAAGVDKIGTDEDVFFDILGNRNYNQLRLIFDEYKHLAGHDIEYAISKEFSGYAKKALVAFVTSVHDVPTYFAKRLHKCIADTDRHNRVTRIVVTRSEIDMDRIKKEYYNLHHTYLDADITSNTKGLYKEALLNLLRLHH